MKKVLILASVASMIEQFNIPNIFVLQSLGYEVHVACNFVNGNTCNEKTIISLKKKLDEMRVTYFQIDFTRSVFNLKEDLKAYRQVKKIMDINHYEFVHCHSPIGGVIGRIACKTTKTKCIYTAHGFHFFKGGPIMSWIVFYPIEKLLSNFTDVLITINEEDYKLARKKFKAKKVIKVPGIGIEVKKYSQCSVEKKEYRKKIGLASDEIMVLSVGELSDRKNHETVIKALSLIQNKKVKYFIAGQGEKKEHLLELIKRLNLSDRVFLLGYRDDIHILCNVADVFVFPSKREGLGLAAIEAMAAGLPVVSSNINGIKDYSVQGITGYLYAPKDYRGFAEGIKKCIGKDFSSNKLRAKKYDVSNVNKIMEKLYRDC